MHLGRKKKFAETAEVEKEQRIFLQHVCNIIGGVLVTKDVVSIKVFHLKATIPTGLKNPTSTASEKEADLVTELSAG